MGESRPPPFVICHLCGRKYGTKSIAIHTPQCQKKWHSENKKLPKHLRRRLPSQPDYGKLQAGDYSSDMIDQMNEMSFKASQAQLIPCQNCGRTFYPEKLPVHQKSCTTDRPARAPVPVRGNTSSGSRNTHNASGKIDKKQNDEKQQKSKPKKSDQVAMILCAICMKQIPSEKIQTHLVGCNQEKIMSIQQAELSKDDVEVSSEKNERPKTRTIRRAESNKPESNYDKTDSLTANDKDGTYDIIKPSASYTIEKSVVVDNDLFPCDLCNRKFNKDRINQHKAICSKVKGKGRRTFDSSKQRCRGVQICNQNKHKEKSITPPKSNWRQTHKEFIQSIRAAKDVSAHMAKGGKASDIPPPPPSLNPKYVHCQHCDRRFNPEVAERHIPKCATITNRPAPPKKKALDVYNSQVKDKDLKTSETFSVRQTSVDKLHGLLSANASYPSAVDKKLNHHPQKKTRNDCSGYVSPRVEKRYDSFEQPATKNNSYRPRTSLGDYKAANSDNSAKDKHVTRKISSQKNTGGYSYNSDRRKSPPRNKNFIF